MLITHLYVLFNVLLVTFCVTAELQLVHVVFRHGERTPADTYPNDPHINSTFEPVGWGQLTNQGKLDQYKQGKFLRRRYGNFLGDLYSSEVMHVQSTDVDRTKMSAQLEMAGLWPPKASQKWNEQLDWQPIPIHSQPLGQDSLLIIRIPCNRYYEQLEIVMRSPEVVKMLEKLDANNLYKELSHYTGSKICSPDDIQSLYSTLKAELGFNLTLPAWTGKFYPDKLAPLTAYSYVLNAYNEELQMLKGGPLLKKILSDTVAKSEGTLKPAGRKMYAYAGHDSTITNLLQALHVWDQQIPDYGIMVMVELHQRPGMKDHVVQVYLRNSTSHAPYPLTLPGCDHMCPLKTFVSLTKHVIPDNLTENCVPNDPNYIPYATPPP